MDMHHIPLPLGLNGAFFKSPPALKKIKRARKTMYTFTLDFTVSILMARPPAKEAQVERSSAIKLNKSNFGLTERLITVIR